MSSDSNSAPCLSAENLFWKVGNKTILQDININLLPGETLGIIGPNGAGKSSLLKILAGILKPSNGSLSLDNKPYGEIDPKLFAQQLSYLEQSSSVHWPLLVSKVIELGRIPHQNISQKLTKQDHEAIEQAVLATGIHDLLPRVFTELSEGEKMLVSLARILASQTNIILTDEPVAALDPYHQLLIMELLQGLSQTEGKRGVIIVLHDLSLAARFCDRLILLSKGKIVSQGTIEDVLTTENLQQFYKINSEIDYNNKSVLTLSRAK